MKTKAKIQKWGNGLALRISGAMRNIPGFSEGEVVEVEITEEGILLKKINPNYKLSFPFSESELLEGMNQDA